MSDPKSDLVNKIIENVEKALSKNIKNIYHDIDKVCPNLTKAEKEEVLNKIITKLSEHYKFKLKNLNQFLENEVVIESDDYLVEVFKEKFEEMDKSKLAEDIESIEDKLFERMKELLRANQKCLKMQQENEEKKELLKKYESELEDFSTLLENQKMISELNNLQ